MNYTHGKFPINTRFVVAKGFLVDTLTHEPPDDNWTFSASVASFPLNTEKVSKKRPENVTGYEWRGSLSIRHGNTRICLHEPDNDPGLGKLEEKLTLIRNKLTKYADMIESRLKDPVKTKFMEREWLNPEEWNVDFTGYISAFISGDGHSRITLSDCHKAISLWFDPPYPPEEGVVQFEDVFAQQNKQAIRNIVKAAQSAIDHIDILRAGFKRTLKEFEAEAK